MGKKNTPWGLADREEILAPGIISYSTPGHGGIWLSPERRQELNYSKNWLKTPEWWEEDCDWAVPYVFFADDIRGHGTAWNIEGNILCAEETAARHHPEWFKQYIFDAVKKRGLA
jgi:hypothetical protein